MATLAELQAQLDSLRKARATGVRSSEYEGIGRVEYRTDGELAAAIADLERQIGAASGPPVRTVYITGSKGV